MDEKYQSALNKILKLASENKEFGDALRKALSVPKATHDSEAASIYKNAQIDSIEHYLGLDYTVDTQDATIDYSFVADQFAYRQLVSDNREMMRFRYGTRYHKTDFLEFCRFALLQAEMLINYLYNYNKPSFESIKQRIVQFNKKANLDSNETLESINFSVKFWAFCSEFKLSNPTKTTIDNVRQIRNEQSHRSLTSEDFSICEYQAWLNHLNMPLKQNGEVDWFAIQDKEDLLNIYSTQINRSDKYKTYCYALWCKRQPFDEVQQAILKLAKCVSSNIPSE